MGGGWAQRTIAALAGRGCPLVENVPAGWMLYAVRFVLDNADGL